MPLSHQFYSFFRRALPYGFDIAVLALMLAIVIISYRSLQHPVGATQFQHLELLARQQVHPHTQAMTLKLLREYDYISYGQYLKVIHAQQYEQRQAQQFPALHRD